MVQYYHWSSLEATYHLENNEISLLEFHYMAYIGHGFRKPIIKRSASQISWKSKSVNSIDTSILDGNMHIVFLSIKNVIDVISILNSLERGQRFKDYFGACL